MTDRPRYPRTGCVVPFCRRTSARFPGEWMCGDHWRLVGSDLKRLRTRVLRRRGRVYAKARGEREALEAQQPGSKAAFMAWRRERRAYDRYQHAAETIWSLMKRRAIERAGGIA